VLSLLRLHFLLVPNFPNFMVIPYLKPRNTDKLWVLSNIAH